MLADLDENGIRTTIGTVSATLNGTDSANLEVFSQTQTNGLVVMTGADYYVDKVNNQYVQIPWNVCDKSRDVIYYPRKSGENFGKASTYLNDYDQCCIYCKTKDADGNIIFSNNLYCSALDAECDGSSYTNYTDPCGGGSGGGSSGGSDGGVTVPGAGGGDTTGTGTSSGGTTTGGGSTGGLGTGAGGSSGGGGGGIGVAGA